jgi:hypothetical protein
MNLHIGQSAAPAFTGGGDFQWFDDEKMTAEKRVGRVENQFPRKNLLSN